MNQETIDPRPVHVKIARVAGAIHFITVLPPSEQKSDDTVWAHRKQSDAQRLNPMIYEGPSFMSDYAATKEQFQ